MNHSRDELIVAIRNSLRVLELHFGRDAHLAGTPERVVSAWEEMVSGYEVNPASFLEKRFEAGAYDEMIHVGDIPFTSLCAHHMMPFIGKIHFSYVPEQPKENPTLGRPTNGIVGLSKIPRFIGALTKRLQVQERLTQQIADCFQTTVEPAGCGVHIKAYHTCMQARGVRVHESITTTTALRGNYKTNPTVRAEFLSVANVARPIF